MPVSESAEPRRELRFAVLPTIAGALTDDLLDRGDSKSEFSRMGNVRPLSPLVGEPKSREPRRRWFCAAAAAIEAGKVCYPDHCIFCVDPAPK